METKKESEEKPLLPYQDFSQSLRDMKKNRKLPPQLKGLLEIRESMSPEKLREVDTFINRMMGRRNEPENSEK